MYGLIVLHQHSHHRPRHARRARGYISVDLRIVGVLEFARVHPPEEPDEGESSQSQSDGEPRAALLPGLDGRLRSSVLRLRCAVALPCRLLELLFRHFRSSLLAPRDASRGPLDSETL